MLEGDHDAATGSGCGTESRAIFPTSQQSANVGGWWRRTLPAFYWPSAFLGSGILAMITHTFYLPSELPNPAIATESVLLKYEIPIGRS